MNISPFASSTSPSFALLAQPSFERFNRDTIKLFHDCAIDPYCFNPQGSFMRMLGFGESEIYIPGYGRLYPPVDRKKWNDEIMQYVNLFYNSIDLKSIIKYKSRYGLVNYTFYIYYNDNFDMIIPIDNNFIAEDKQKLSNVIMNDINIFNNNIVIRTMNQADFYVLRNSDIIKYMPAYEELIGRKPASIISDLLQRYPNEAIKYIEKNMEKYPEFANLTINTPSYFPYIHDLGNKYLEYASKNVVNEDDIKRTYYYLASIILSKPTHEPLTDEERNAVLEYLLNAEDIEDAPRLRKNLYLEMIGMPINTQVDFDINLDVETLIKLGKMWAQCKK